MLIGPDISASVAPPSVPGPPPTSGSVFKESSRSESFCFQTLPNWDPLYLDPSVFKSLCIPQSGSLCDPDPYEPPSFRSRINVNGSESLLFPNIPILTIFQYFQTQPFVRDSPPNV
jgi:hypothetical protein